MRRTVREVFDRVLAVASIDNAFQRHVSCERSVLRVRDDLYDLEFL